MNSWKPLGTLERSVMNQLWNADKPVTVRQVHDALLAERALAYTTVMTVLRRLADKGLARQLRDGRAHRYAAVHSHDELVASLMVDALEQVTDAGSRHSALLHFVEKVGAREMQALQMALAAVEFGHLGKLRPTA